MSKPLDSKYCMFFYSIIFNQQYMGLEEVIRYLDLDFTHIKVFLPFINPLKNYYSQEMGDDRFLRRFIIFDSQLKNREKLVEEKLKSLSIEEEHLNQAEKRFVNIDPGYISLENCILSTFKPYSHRIYLSEGVWAEPNYYYQHGSYHPFPWTYPDYQHLEKIASFNTQRDLLKKLL